MISARFPDTLTDHIITPDLEGKKRGLEKMWDKGIAFTYEGSVVMKMTPIGLHRFAQEYLSIVKIPEKETPFSPVPYFLVCRSIELSLKAFLCVKNIPMSELMKKGKYGHDLETLFNNAKDLGIDRCVPFAKNIEKEIRKANEYYNNKEFEYYEALRGMKGYTELPDLLILKGFADELVIGLEVPCTEACSLTPPS